MYRNYIEDRTDYKEQAWKSFRNITTNTIKAAETKYYQNKLVDQNNNSKALWNTFGKILKKPKSKININKIIKDNNILTNTDDIANALNIFFTNIGNNLAQAINREGQNAYKEYLTDPNPKSFHLCETSLFEMKHRLEKINPKKATGNDEIPGKF